MLRDKQIKITDRNIKVINDRYHIHKYFKSINMRISTNLKATQENFILLKTESHKYVKKYLFENGYIDSITDKLSYNKITYTFNHTIQNHIK